MTSHSKKKGKLSRLAPKSVKLCRVRYHEYHQYSPMLLDNCKTEAAKKKSDSPGKHEVNGINVLMGISQLKSAILYVTGNKYEAKKVQEDFLTTCPVVSQVTSGVQLLNGDKESAKRSWGRFCGYMNGAVNSIPVIGHVKGGIHLLAGDTEGAKEALLSASRTTAVMAGGFAGIPGGPALIFAGGIAAATAVDGAVTKVNKSSYGVFAAAKECIEKPSVGGIFDAVVGVISDGAEAQGGARKKKKK